MIDKPVNSKDIDENKLMAALSYIWAFSVVMMLLKKDSPFVQFHARQGFVLFVISVIFMIIAVLWWANIIVAVYCIIGIWSAYQGKEWKAPLIYQIAQKVKF
jgi:uncharacterized membrane protein